MALVFGVHVGLPLGVAVSKCSIIICTVLREGVTNNRRVSLKAVAPVLLGLVLDEAASTAVFQVKLVIFIALGFVPGEDVSGGIKEVEADFAVVGRIIFKSVVGGRAGEWKASIDPVTWLLTTITPVS